MLEKGHEIKEKYAPRLDYLEIIKNIENWQLTNIKDISYMFYNCAKLDVDLSNWDLTNIKKSFKIGIVTNSGITKNHYPKLK